jgi:hypothetical protein
MEIWIELIAGTERRSGGYLLSARGQVLEIGVGSGRNLSLVALLGSIRRPEP